MDEAFTNWLKQSRRLKAGDVLTKEQYDNMHRQYLEELAVNSYERGRGDGIGAVLEEFLTGKPADPSAQQRKGGMLARIFTGGAAPSGEQQQQGMLARIFTGGAAPSGEQQQQGALARVFTGGAAPSAEQQQQGGALARVFTGGAAPAVFSAAEFKRTYGVELPAGNYRDPKGRLFTIR